jgi:hypothetical protein
MYAGFAVAWYAVLAAGYVATFPSHGNHFLVAVGFFLCLPALFAGCCGLSAELAPKRRKDALQAAYVSRRLTRRYAFSAGLAAGAVSMLALAAVGWLVYPHTETETGVIIALAGAVTVLAVSPLFGLWLLSRKAAAA